MADISHWHVGGSAFPLRLQPQLIWVPVTESKKEPASQSEFITKYPKPWPAEKNYLLLP